MREHQPSKRAGDQLYYQDVNRLAGISNRMASSRPGAYISRMHAGSFVSDSVDPPWAQGVFEVQGPKTDDNDEPIDFQYLIRFRWYDPTVSDDSVTTDNPDGDPNGWTTDDTKDWDLDVSDFELTLAKGDLIVAFWDDGRGMFIPATREENKCRRCKGNLASALASGDASVSVNNAVSADGGTFPFSTSSVSGVLNTFRFTGNSGAPCRFDIIIVSNASDSWELTNVAWTSSPSTPSTPSQSTVDVVVDLQVSVLLLQYKTRSVVGAFTSDSGSWTTWATGTSCASTS
jgi:hypothetical protein